jgi:hypothetical protein
MNAMPRKRISLVDALGEARAPVYPTIGTRVPERYAHQSRESVVAQFERDITEVAKFLIDDNLVRHADVKAALVRCIDELLVTYRGR